LHVLSAATLRTFITYHSFRLLHYSYVHRRAGEGCFVLILSLFVTHVWFTIRLWGLFIDVMGFILYTNYIFCPLTLPLPLNLYITQNFLHFYIFKHSKLVFSWGPKKNSPQEQGFWILPSLSPQHRLHTHTHTHTYLSLRDRLSEQLLVYVYQVFIIHGHFRNICELLI